MLLGRTAMQRMGIVVKEGVKKVIKTSSTTEKGVFSCTTIEEKVIINNKYPEQTVTIRKQLPEHATRRLRDFLKANMYVFAWTHADMTGIPRTIMVKGKSLNTEHKLNEYTYVKPIKQKRRGLVPDRNTVACKEMGELMKAGILQKVKHQTWVANPVMNAGATYQRLVDKVFHDQIGRNLEAYVKDMVIKSTFEEEMLADIKETFEKFRSINMKLNRRSVPSASKKVHS
ncbi:hypothetical protein Tco_0884746 [Tanacetum coccineum]